MLCGFSGFVTVRNTAETPAFFALSCTLAAGNIACKASSAACAVFSCSGV
nr:MAG TPA: hypothetical protein [Caudoviricetes sp.]